jgi:N-acylneuraminate cytidylyltransferase
LGQPLLSWSINAARKCADIDAIAVSSDGDEILAIAHAEGVHAIRRPDELASDTALPKDAVLHALDTLEAEGEAPFDVLVLLQPTSPLRLPGDISACLACVTEQGADSAATFKSSESHPARVWRIEDGVPAPFLSGQKNWAPRQALAPVYALNGAVYVVRIAAFRAEPGPAFLFGNSAAVVMPSERSLDIDTLYDFKMTEAAARLLGLDQTDRKGE